MASNSKPVIVAVDGPAGSGKSSICGLVCERIGFTYINTGLLYRAVAYLASDGGLLAKHDWDMNMFDGLNHEWHSRLHFNLDQKRVIIDDMDVTIELKSVKIGQYASLISQNETLRETLLPIQRKLALGARKGAVLDGRDIGTVVFPDADLKVFITASIEVRAKRRLLQLKQLGKNHPEDDIKRIEEHIRRRDLQDTTREHAPLKMAEDAILLDNSDINFDQAVDRFVALLQERGLAANPG